MGTINLVLQMLIAGIIVGAIYGLVALGFVTIYRCSGVVNFAQGESVMLGALMTMYLLKVSSLTYFAAAAVAVVITTLIGVLVYQLVVAHLRNATIISLIMALLGVSMFIQNGALIAWGGWPQALPPFSGTVPFRLGAVSVAPQGLWVILMAAVVLGGLYLLNNLTLFGKKMTATATQPQAASLVGIPRGSMIRWSFAISAAVGAVAGLFLAAIVPMNYASGSAFGLKGFIAGVLGGWGKSTGAVVGGLILGIVETFSAVLLPAGYMNAVAFLVFILILYFRPSGILGSSLVEAE
jgi:branched-chain amino acid transport system permease protein